MAQTTKPAINLQDSFLNRFRKENWAVEISLVNGTLFKGRVVGFDSFTVILEDDDGWQRLVYKHAVAAIAPVDKIKIMQPERISVIKEM